MSIKGETLLEVMVSISIMAIALTGAFVLVVNTTRMVSANKYKSQGTAYAEEGSDIAYNFLKGCNGPGDGYYYIAATGDTLNHAPSGVTDTTSTNTSIQVGSLPYRRLITITSVNTLPSAQITQLLGSSVSPNAANYWLVDTKVQWQIGNMTPDTTELKTIVAKTQ